MDYSPFTTIISKLRHDFSSFSQPFQAGAKYLLDFPEEVAVNSMRSIAASIGVHPSTLVRLAQELGFDGWQGLREVFANNLRENRAIAVSPTSPKLDQTERGTASAVLPLFSAQRQNLHATQRKIATSLLSAAEIIETATQVYVAGSSQSLPIAYRFYYLYSLFRPSVHPVGTGVNGIDLGVRAIDERSCLVVVSVTPYEVDDMRLVHAAKRRGATIVAVTDSVVSPIALSADTMVLSDCSCATYPSSMVAAIAAVEGLAGLLFSRQGTLAATRVAAFEREQFESGAYIR